VNEPIETPVPDETVTEPASPPKPAKRGRVRWYHVLVLGVAVLACAAAVGFSTSQSSDRDEATAARRDAQEAVADQRADTSRAKEQLASERETTKATLADVDTITTSVHELTDLTGQEVDTLASVNQLAITSPDAFDEINAQLARAGLLLEQMHTKALAIEEQAKELERRGDAQFAAAVMSGA
jgi:hypothetical protein